MLQPSPPPRLLATCCLCASLALLTAGAIAAPPGFDLDLKELKKPPTVIVTHKKQAPAQKAPKASAAARTITKKTTAPTKTAQASKKLVSPPVPHQTPVPPDVAEQIILLDGKTACRLAQLLLEAVAEPTPVAETLQGLPLTATSAARLQGATVVLTCGLPTAEAYTFRRLLEADGIQLINLAGDEQASQVVQTVALGLGLSYRQQQDNPLSYLTNDSQSRPVRLIIGSSGTIP